MDNFTELNNTHPAVIYLCDCDIKLKKLIGKIGTISIRKRDANDSYVFLIHEILEQMLSKKTAEKIYARFINLCNGSITPQKVHSLTYEEIKGIGTSNSKVSYIEALTEEVMNGRLDFISLKELPDEQVIKKLTEIRGIGIWTAKMYLIFVLNRENILPYEDAAFLQAYKWLYPDEKTDKKSIEKNTLRWNPYRSFAARYLYTALDMGITKI